jgi:hypothetical protein
MLFEKRLLLSKSILKIDLIWFYSKNGLKKTRRLAVKDSNFPGAFM